MRSTEVVITEKKQENSNIELGHIYDAIRYLEPEQQMNILANYKFIELYDILSSKETYEKYIDRKSTRLNSSHIH